MVLGCSGYQLRLLGLISCPGLISNRSGLKFSSYSNFPVHMMFVCRPCRQIFAGARNLPELILSPYKSLYITWIFYRMTQEQKYLTPENIFNEGQNFEVMKKNSTVTGPCHIPPTPSSKWRSKKERVLRTIRKSQSPRATPHTCVSMGNLNIWSRKIGLRRGFLMIFWKIWFYHFWMVLVMFWHVFMPRDGPRSF